MKQITDVAIVGGGVIGCALAYQLRKRGVDVSVVDRGEIGAAASSAATGLLAPIRPFLKPQDPYMSLQLTSLALFPSLASELEEASGLSIEYERTGTLRVVQLRHETRLRTWIQNWRKLGFRMELLADEQLHQFEPLLAERVVAAVYNPDEPQVNAARLVRAYARAAEELGAFMLPHTPVIGILRRGQSATGITTPQGNIACNQLVIAAGAWSAACGEWLNLPLPVRPLRGQCFAVVQPGSPLRHIIFGERTYLAPKTDGTIFVGATRDDVGFDCSTTLEGIAWLRQAAQNLAPTLETCELQRSWAGLRPQTPDSRPLLGPAPGWENVILACGHGGFGMLLSAITSQLVAELLTTGHLPPLIAPFGFERFAHQIQERPPTHAA
jgi:glycine oxidase